MITKEDFENLKNGDLLVGKGNSARVVRDTRADGRLLRCLIQFPGHGTEEATWFDDLGIVDEEVGTYTHFEGPEPYVRKAG